MTTAGRHVLAAVDLVSLFEPSNHQKLIKFLSSNGVVEYLNGIGNMRAPGATRLLYLYLDGLDLKGCTKAKVPISCIEKTLTFYASNSTLDKDMIGLLIKVGSFLAIAEKRLLGRALVHHKLPLSDFLYVLGTLSQTNYSHAHDLLHSWVMAFGVSNEGLTERDRCYLAFSLHVFHSFSGADDVAALPQIASPTAALSLLRALVEVALVVKCSEFARVWSRCWDCLGEIGRAAKTPSVAHQRIAVCLMEFSCVINYYQSGASADEEAMHTALARFCSMHAIVAGSARSEGGCAVKVFALQRMVTAVQTMHARDTTPDCGLATKAPLVVVRLAAALGEVLLGLARTNKKAAQYSVLQLVLATLEADLFDSRCAITCTRLQRTFELQSPGNGGNSVTIQSTELEFNKKMDAVVLILLLLLEQSAINGLAPRTLNLIEKILMHPGVHLDPPTMARALPEVRDAGTGGSSDALAPEAAAMVRRIVCARCIHVRGLLEVAEGSYLSWVATAHAAALGERCEEYTLLNKACQASEQSQDGELGQITLMLQICVTDLAGTLRRDLYTDGDGSNSRLPPDERAEVLAQCTVELMVTNVLYEQATVSSSESGSDGPCRMFEAAVLEFFDWLLASPQESLRVALISETGAPVAIGLSAGSAPQWKHILSCFLRGFVLIQSHSPASAKDGAGLLGSTAARLLKRCLFPLGLLCPILVPAVVSFALVQPDAMALLFRAIGYLQDLSFVPPKASVGSRAEGSRGGEGCVEGRVAYYIDLIHCVLRENVAHISSTMARRFRQPLHSEIVCNASKVTAEGDEDADADLLTLPTGDYMAASKLSSLAQNQTALAVSASVYAAPGNDGGTQHSLLQCFYPLCRTLLLAEPPAIQPKNGIPETVHIRVRAAAIRVIGQYMLCSEELYRENIVSLEQALIRSVYVLCTSREGADKDTEARWLHRCAYEQAASRQLLRTWLTVFQAHRADLTVLLRCMVRMTITICEGSSGVGAFDRQLAKLLRQCTDCCSGLIDSGARIGRERDETVELVALLAVLSACLRGNDRADHASSDDARSVATAALEGAVVRFIMRHQRQADNSKTRMSSSSGGGGVLGIYCKPVSKVILLLASQPAARPDLPRTRSAPDGDVNGSVWLDSVIDCTGSDSEASDGTESDDSLPKRRRLLSPESRQKVWHSRWMQHLRSDPRLSLLDPAAANPTDSEDSDIASTLHVLLGVGGGADQVAVRAGVTGTVLTAVIDSPCYNAAWLVDVEQKLVLAALHRNSSVAAACLGHLPVHTRESKTLVESWQGERRLGMLSERVEADLLRHVCAPGTNGKKKCYRAHAGEGAEWTEML